MMINQINQWVSSSPKNKFQYILQPHSFNSEFNSVSNSGFEFAYKNNKSFSLIVLFNICNYDALIFIFAPLHKTSII
jgi:hypothetical protein